ncbi:hypothetical protein AB0O01_35115 [Streptomyces sp. NPDC093252]|uniref:hypothetical protein n=1 Tax=Streptomyces sp. NPDC093252 TaxID=3154980 RepID=UPI00344A58D5
MSASGAGQRAGERAGERRRVAAAWAVFGKDPRDRQNYGVHRARHGQYAYFAQLLAGYVPEVSVDAVPVERPYYVYWPGPRTLSGQPTVNCGRTDRTTTPDAVGRPSETFRFFSLESHRLRPGSAGPGACGFHDLADAMDRAVTAMPDTEDAWAYLDLDATAERPPARPRDVEWLIAGAAALLAGRVAVTGAQGIGPAERLRTLDALCALLPYRLRFELSAATFAAGNGRHGLRLFFGDPAPADAYELPWHGPRAPLPPAAVRYHHWLTERLGDGLGDRSGDRLGDRLGDRSGNWPGGRSGDRPGGGAAATGAVLGSLASALVHGTENCSLDSPESVLRAAAHAVPNLTDLITELRAARRTVHRLHAYLDAAPALADIPVEVRAEAWDLLLTDHPAGPPAGTAAGTAATLAPGPPPGPPATPTPGPAYDALARRLRTLDLPPTTDHTERLADGLHLVAVTPEGRSTARHHLAQTRQAPRPDGDRAAADLLRGLLDRLDPGDRPRLDAWLTLLTVLEEAGTAASRLAARFAAPDPVPFALLRRALAPDAPAGHARALLHAAVPSGTPSPPWLLAPRAVLLGGPPPDPGHLAALGARLPGYLDLIDTLIRGQGTPAPPWLTGALIERAAHHHTVSTTLLLELLTPGTGPDTPSPARLREALDHGLHPATVVARLLRPPGPAHGSDLLALLREAAGDHDTHLLPLLAALVATGRSPDRAEAATVSPELLADAESLLARLASPFDSDEDTAARAEAGLKDVGRVRALLRKLRPGGAK